MQTEQHSTPSSFQRTSEATMLIDGQRFDVIAQFNFLNRLKLAWDNNARHGGKASQFVVAINIFNTDFC